MKYKQNLHTHSTYCDGKDTLKQMLETAIEKGFDSIGFSTHSYMYYSNYFAQKPDWSREYFKEVNRLKEEYRDRIKIFCGIEYDIYSDIDISYFDYAIGAVHYLKIGDEFVGFDRDAQQVEKVIKDYFDGDGMKYAKMYYEQLSKLPNYGKFDIIAHFDLVAKHSEKTEFFNENSKEYLSYAISAAEALSGKIPLFEVNTGAIARGYRTTPYPSLPILKELKRLGYGAVITSDCHNKEMLDCHFDEARELLSECGFKEKYILTDSGFVQTEL